MECVIGIARTKDSDEIDVMKTSFYSQDELKDLGLKSYGESVFISRKASIYSPECVSLGHHVRIDDFCILSGHVTLGSYIHISAYNGLYAAYGIELEDCSGISPRCTLFSASDDFGGNFLVGPLVPEKYTRIEGGKILVKRFSQIGAGSIILPGVTVNEGVAVGAMSLVKKDLDPWGIYAGNPIRFIRKREKGLLGLYRKWEESV
jgi:acetyltransferase-like isoleucine patch superfamily enzyme